MFIGLPDDSNSCSGVFANVSLHNNKKLKKHTRLTVETGNGYRIRY